MKLEINPIEAAILTSALTNHITLIQVYQKENPEEVPIISPALAINICNAMVAKIRKGE